MTTPITAIKRIQREYNDLLRNSSNYWTVRPKDTANMLVWEGNIHDLDDPRHHMKNYSLEIIFSENHPFTPPKIRFLDKVDCQFVNPENGDICLDILRETWSPAIMVWQLMISVCSVLTDKHVNGVSYRHSSFDYRYPRRHRHNVDRLSPSNQTIRRRDAEPLVVDRQTVDRLAA